MKHPTDQDLRLYARLSDVDPDLILDSALPTPAAPAADTAKKNPRKASAGFRAHPWAASLGLCAVALTLVLALLWDLGALGSVVEPPAPHESQGGDSASSPLPPGMEEPGIPTLEDAASLRKGMSFSELVALMGTDYTKNGSRYTFTLDTGEQLAVDTEFVYGGNVGSRVTGFAWLGSAAEIYNPMGISEEILPTLQDYATDTVIPIYTVDSLIELYGRVTPPTLDEVLSGTEMRYLRRGANGEAMILDGEGHRAERNPPTEVFPFLENVSALFDDTVQVKGYYPILTRTLTEREAVCFQTSIGDYILYLHGGSLPLVTVPEGSEAGSGSSDSLSSDAVPYLMPLSVFHEFAAGVVADQFPNYGMGWVFLQNRMATIEPYKLDGEGDQKPSGVGTPGAAEQLRVGMPQDELIRLMGQGLSSDTHRGLGIFYWKFSDGWGLFVYCRSDPGFTESAEPCVTDIVWLEAGDVLDALGQPSSAVVSRLIRTKMSREAVVSLLGKAPGGTFVSSSGSVPQLSTSSWTWEEDKKTYTFTVHWITTPDAVSGAEEIRVGEMTLTGAPGLGEKPTPAMAELVTVGMTDNAVLSQMNGTPVMTDFRGDGILYVWELSDGRFFGVVLENRTLPEVESLTYRFTVTHTFYWDTAEEIGQPTKANAERITPGMSYAAVVTLVGEPDTIRKRNDGTIQSTVHWLTDRNLLGVDIEWHVTRDAKTGTPTHTVYEAVIAVG